MTDWGRKQESLLAFEQVGRFVEASNKDNKAAKQDPDRAFYHEALSAKRREGFLWQKLRDPRSFDYQKAQNKGYHEHLLMGQFEFTPQQREAIMTFVLGLVAEPPAAKYVFAPDKPTRAIVEGRKVLDKYACASCHVLEMEQWTFEFDPELIDEPFPMEGHEFLRPRMSPEQLTASAAIDPRGLGQVTIGGMPQVGEDGLPLMVDDDIDDRDNEAFLYSFTLWEPAAINGQIWPVGGADLLLWSSELGATAGASTGWAGQFDVRYFGSRLTAIRRPVGGQFSRFLFPTALSDARAAGSSAAGPEAWGWLPPPLVGEGAKVQPAWLHAYLLAPHPIRPAAVLRMPRYNFSPGEAGKLVDYFAATAGVEFPYMPPISPRNATTGDVAKQRDEAMRMVADTQTYCAKCHLVGDFSPGGRVRTILAPNLADVQQRLRPEYLRRWLADPKSVLPYTGMPDNFPATGESVDPARFPGSSVEQLEAVRDLLLDYDRYISGRVSIRAMIESNVEAERVEPQ